MSIHIIKRGHGENANELINAYGDTRPQISYNSEGRIAIRVLHGSQESDTLIVLDRPLTESLIHFVKNGIMEMPRASGYCKKCSKEINGLPF